ncbi:methyltransferase domain-containing protein [Aeromicrobium sp.]|uniref:class I SAM-dependent methyltransferase n=1 Tax=Aeromicrobium sp. TaxID=1871063 RepID=UPI001982C7DC|nr:methyltransferase domain-containing protein [Aeromicrobium sp.]MBC7632894.1 methyltransferase domain-containing protein [Aeromicrobium sp.]
MRPLRVPRYGAGAVMYDLVSFEWPVYRVGRLRAIEQLRLAEGDVVLDIGCGTGLNFAPLRERIASSGHIVGVDASESMLAQARRKIGPAGGVTLVHADAGRLDELVADLTFDAVICTYALSIIPDWRAAWTAARAATRPGGRLAVVDLALPAGAGRLLEPAARLACFTGGVDRDRRPWTLVEDELEDVVTERHRSGHVVVSAGTNTATTAGP